ncbi:MAG: CBS domain-containing protein [Planctomycetota bacterium]|jgi:tRNA nucleotidyltransferase (CCA-adding enzyme)
MFKAKDIMTETTITVREETPIYEAVELIVKYGISGMPVVKDDMTLVGIVSEKDLIKLFYEKVGENKTVGDFMTQPAVHFDEDESLLDICDFLMKNIFRRVPITSKDKLVGIISIKDTLEYILELRRPQADLQRAAK